MRNPKLTYAIMVAIAAAMIASSCKKNKLADSSTSAKKTCKIASATRTSGSSSATYLLSYDDSDRISTVNYNGPDAYTKHFTYNKKMIYVYTDAGVNSSTDTITLNTEGFIASIKESVPNAVYNSVYTFDANGVLVNSSTQQDSYPSTTLNYSFSNGDLLYTSGSDGSKDTLTYYNDRLATIGDPDQFYQFSYFGAYYYKNKHLKKTLDAYPYHFTYAYSFDSDDKIVSVFSNYGATADTLNFTYTCP